LIYLLVNISSCPNIHHRVVDWLGFLLPIILFRIWGKEKVYLALLLINPIIEIKIKDRFGNKTYLSFELPFVLEVDLFLRLQSNHRDRWNQSPQSHLHPEKANNLLLLSRTENEKFLGRQFSKSIKYSMLCLGYIYEVIALM